ncbi:MAG: hypothetical protein DHS80DRAFT_30153 [Piptocephalis tieghemiana]|nr:MAG: hypothetical protein DHS80DRAFT_30153 [Piptocephalis tieghemiana]
MTTCSRDSQRELLVEGGSFLETDERRDRERRRWGHPAVLGLVFLFTGALVLLQLLSNQFGPPPPPPILPSKLPSSRIAIFVLTSPLTLDDRGQAVADTWAKVAADHGVDVFFTSYTDTYPTFGVHAIQVNNTDYEHIYQKVYTAFAWLGARIEDRGYDWIMKADDDTYIDIPHLLHHLRDRDPHVPRMFGKSEYSREGTMCWGGPGYIVSRAFLSRLLPHLEACSRGEDGVYVGSEDISLASCAYTHIPNHEGCHRFRPWMMNSSLDHPLQTGWEDFVSIDGRDDQWNQLGLQVRNVDRENQLPWSFENSTTYHKVLPKTMYRLHAWIQRRSL